MSLADMSVILPLPLPALASVHFFFYCSGDHRDLHSFPTRRSSDLAAVFAEQMCEHLAAVEAGLADDDPWHGFASYIRADRKSTRLNSSHVEISYAVFCLKKKKKHRCEL